MRMTADTYVLHEMFESYGDGSVMGDITSYYEERREEEEAAGLPHFDGIDFLLRSGVLVETDGEYRVVDDAWETGNSAPDDSEVAQAMRHALEATEVGWCGEMKGYEFADQYFDASWERFDTEEEYLESIETFVACGS
ncbi:hypothetical protein [Nocardiopsis sp. LOL_012]|uniref:hypothetical protein n=1 Tax=Nocardiopsis sp. LOL_012 TaxID=3345409 RepID=UPI003A8AB6C4